MSSEPIILRGEGFELTLDVPGTLYKGVRFDWTGVFRDISRDGAVLAGKWNDGNDLCRHDNVSGPSEEFSPVWIDKEHCVKIGVGILSVPGGEGEYDRFRLYEIADCGTFALDVNESSACFTHRLDGWYEYKKCIRLEGGALRLEHSLRWLSDLHTRITCYNHNFFNFGLYRIGPMRTITFDAPVSGDWRPDSVSGYINGSALCFERDMHEGEKCFIGNLSVPACEGKPYHIVLSEGERRIDISCDAPMEESVFWSNHMVACIEPYIALDLSKGETEKWTILYK